LAEAYRVVVRKNKNSKSLEKLYNTNDLKDANEIYHHWIIEAKNGEIIELYHGSKKTNEQVKSGKSEMRVLKPK